MPNLLCGACNGGGWVCEQHPDRPFPHGDCGGPGDVCACLPPGSYPHDELTMNPCPRGTEEAR